MLFLYRSFQSASNKKAKVERTYTDLRTGRCTHLLVKDAARRSEAFEDLKHL